MDLSGVALNNAWPRRRWLRLGLAACAGLAAHAARAATAERDAARSSHFPFGPVLPARPVPGWPVITHRAVATDLAALLRGRITAVHLMFTGCSATCPIQGALFAQAQRLLGDMAAGLQFLSLSIDPLADGPAALDTWLRSFEARPGWSAAAPRPADVDRLIALLGSGGETRPGGSDPHTGQVFIIDRRGELVFRTPAMPAAADIVAAMRGVAARA